MRVRDTTGQFEQRPYKATHAPSNIKQSARHTTKQIITCPYCEGSKIIRKGVRRNKLGDIQLYFCRHCEKKFSPLLNKNRTYPVRVILEALSHYNRLKTFEQAAETVSEKYGLSVSRQAVSNWHASFADYLSFSHWRAKIKRAPRPDKMIIEDRLLHGLVYIYKYHATKMALILRERRGVEPFITLQDYLAAVPATCPHALFRTQKGRASAQKGGFDITGVTIKPVHNNAAIKTARLVLQAVSNNKRRHSC
jgi:transposase-like protein